MKRIVHSIPSSVSDLDIKDLGLCYSADIPLAVELDLNQETPKPVRYFWFQVCLVLGDSLVSTAEGVHDLQFGVIWRHVRNESITDGPSFDRAFVARLLNRNERAQLRGLIDEAAGRLLRTCEPQIVTMSTVESDLPDRALRKFEDLARICQANGWRQTWSRRGGDGRDHWYFVKAP